MMLRRHRSREWKHPTETQRNLRKSVRFASGLPAKLCCAEVVATAGEPARTQGPAVNLQWLRTLSSG